MRLNPKRRESRGVKPYCIPMTLWSVEKSQRRYHGNWWRAPRACARCAPPTRPRVARRGRLCSRPIASRSGPGVVWPRFPPCIKLRGLPAYAEAEVDRLRLFRADGDLLFALAVLLVPRHDRVVRRRVPNRERYRWQRTRHRTGAASRPCTSASSRASHLILNGVISTFVELLRETMFGTGWPTLNCEFTAGMPYVMKSRVAVLDLQFLANHHGVDVRMVLAALLIDHDRRRWRREVATDVLHVDEDVGELAAGPATTSSSVAGVWCCDWQYGSAPIGMAAIFGATPSADRAGQRGGVRGLLRQEPRQSCRRGGTTCAGRRSLRLNDVVSPSSWRVACFPLPQAGRG